LLSFLCACAASSSDDDATTDADSSSSSSTTDDPSMTGPVTTAPATTESTTTTTTASDETSSSEGGESSSSDTGESASMFGRYELTGSDATFDPPGCAMDQGGAADWSIDLDDPAGGTMFGALEHYGPYMNQLDCTLDGETFECTYHFELDYGAMGGPDAFVTLDTHYDAQWSADDALAGDYSVAFACDGAGCSEVMGQFDLVAFPCALQVPFTGVLAP
jgi:hypothetical protein